MICQKSQSISNKLPKSVFWLDLIPSDHVFCSFLIALESEYKLGVQSSGTHSLSPTASPSEFVCPSADSNPSLQNVAAVPFKYDT